MFRTTRVALACVLLFHALSQVEESGGAPMPLVLQGPISAQTTPKLPQKFAFMSVINHIAGAGSAQRQLYGQFGKPVHPLVFAGYAGGAASNNLGLIRAKDGEAEQAAHPEIAATSPVDAPSNIILIGLQLQIIPRDALVGLFIILCLFAGIFYFVKRSQRNQRRARRYYCHAHTSIRLDGLESPTTIVDISRVGAKIYGLPTLSPNTAVSLWVGHGWSDGKIIWKNEHFAGIGFAQPLSRVQVRNTITQPSFVATPFGGKKGSDRPVTAFSRKA